MTILVSIMGCISPLKRDRIWTLHKLENVHEKRKIKEESHYSNSDIMQYQLYQLRDHSYFELFYDSLGILDCVCSKVRFDTITEQHDNYETTLQRRIQGNCYFLYKDMHNKFNIAYKDTSMVGK